MLQLGAHTTHGHRVLCRDHRCLRHGARRVGMADHQHLVPRGDAARGRARRARPRCRRRRVAGTGSHGGATIAMPMVVACADTQLSHCFAAARGASFVSADRRRCRFRRRRKVRAQWCTSFRRTVPAHRLQACSAFGGRHLDRRHECTLDRFDVVGVDDQRAVEVLCGTGELAEDQRRIEIAACCHELLGDEVHAVGEGGDDQSVGGTEPCSHVDLVERRIGVDHRHRAVDALMLVG